jgi:hypothetical protein
LNVAASSGTLAVITGQGTRLSFEEITHSAPRDNVDGVATWEFTWTAPMSPGTYVLFGAGNSVNLDGTRLGDLAGTATIGIVVGAGQPTHTPTRTLTGTGTRTRTVTRTPTAPPTPTRTRTGTATPTASMSATPSVTPSATEAPPPTHTSTATVFRPTAVFTPTRTPRPEPTRTPLPEELRGDANCDARVSAADLPTLLLSFGGAVGECLLADADCDGMITGADLQAAIDGVFGQIRADCEAQ